MPLIIRTPKEIIEKEANELGISFEELLELKNEFSLFSDKVKSNNERLRSVLSKAGSLGGKSVSSEKQSIKAKKAAKTNLESGQIHNSFIPAGNKKVRELVESGEWSEISSKGGRTTSETWDGQKEHMASINEEGRKAAAKVTKQKAKNRNQRRLNELSEILESHKWYTAKDIVELYPEFQTNSLTAPTKIFRNFALRNDDFFEVDYKSHQTKRYKLK